jgi:hypothetical protein
VPAVQIWNQSSDQCLEAARLEVAGRDLIKERVVIMGAGERDRPSTTSARRTTIEVRLRKSRSLMVAPEFDASHLRALLAVVESES